MYYRLQVVSLCRHYGDLDGHEVIMKVIEGGEKTLLSTIRPCGMDVPSRALDMSGSLNFMIGLVI